MDESGSNDLEILYEDAHCLAVSKRAGMLTQGWKGGEASLETAVRSHLGDGAYLGTVHRLDRVVSGVVLWAKTPKAARRLAEQFAARSSQKEYRAVVSVPERARLEQTWEDWLSEATGDSGTVQICDSETLKARLARTKVQIAAASRLPSQTRALALFPETGRTHQLRVQAASRGMPILGDRAYGSIIPFGEGIALHARTLRIRHPILDREIMIVADYPQTWTNAGISCESEH